MVRQAEVEQRFLQGFGELYPQLVFRSLRRFPGRRHAPYSFGLRVSFGKAGPELDLACVLLPEGHPANVERALERIAQAGEPDALSGAVSLLVAPYFEQEARQLCASQGVSYLDLSGNGTIDSPRAYLHVSGKPNRLASRKRVQNPFDGRAERVVRRLLLGTDRRWSMRELARLSEVSLGMASMVTSALADEGFVTKSRSGARVARPMHLLEAWARAYDLKASALHTYRSWRTVPQLLGHLREEGKRLKPHYALTLWSGAHSLLGDEGAPPHLALYWDGPLEALAHILRLDEKAGRTYVFVFQPYDASLLWETVESKGLRVVHPLQLYLDLASGDQLDLRLAKRVLQALLRW